MRIRETREEEMQISLQDACVYHKADHCGGSELSNQALANAQHDGYVHGSLHTKEVTRWFAKFRVTEERDMAPEEDMAYNHIIAHDACRRAYKGSCSDNCPVLGQGACMYAIDGIYDNCKKIMEGKEVIE